MAFTEFGFESAKFEVTSQVKILIYSINTYIHIYMHTYMFKGKVSNKDKVINMCEFLYGDICQPKVKVIQNIRHRASHYSQVDID